MISKIILVCASLSLVFSTAMARNFSAKKGSRFPSSLQETTSNEPSDPSYQLNVASAQGSRCDFSSLKAFSRKDVDAMIKAGKIDKNSVLFIDDQKTLAKIEKNKRLGGASYQVASSDGNFLLDGGLALGALGAGYLGAGLEGPGAILICTALICAIGGAVLNSGRGE